MRRRAPTFAAGSRGDVQSRPNLPRDTSGMIDRFLTRIASARSFAGKLWDLTRPYWFAEERQTFRDRKSVV